MSIIVNIYYTGENDNAKKFVEEMITNKIVEQIRNEEGNEGYQYFLPVDDDQTILLIDKWTDQEALDRHHKSDMMKEIAILRKKYHLSMKVEKFTDVKTKK